jgi:hypothetical protein
MAGVDHPMAKLNQSAEVDSDCAVAVGIPVVTKSLREISRHSARMPFGATKHLRRLLGP